MTVRKARVLAVSVFTVISFKNSKQITHGKSYRK